MLTPELLDGTAGFIASCQTYEGGFASASQPYYGVDAGTKRVLTDVRPPLGEAHGGYTFCGLASWIMLLPHVALTPMPTPIPSRHHLSIDYKKLLRWLVQMQGSEIELGGFRGRTNKLVDGCYSWWVGGCFALLASQGVAVARGASAACSRAHGDTGTDVEVHDPAAGDDEWEDVEVSSPPCMMHEELDTAGADAVRGETVWDKMALQRYILCAAQHPAAGLRDKPPKYVDRAPSSIRIPCRDLTRET